MTVFKLLIEFAAERIYKYYVLVRITVVSITCMLRNSLILTFERLSSNLKLKSVSSAFQECLLF